MSTLYEGQVIDSKLSLNAKGGTEMMRDRFLKMIEHSLYENVAIHFSRPQKYHPETNIFYAHDLPDNDFLRQPKFDKYVFVSNYQRDKFMCHSRHVNHINSFVIENAIEEQNPEENKNDDVCRLIYHTTPHRGLEHLVECFYKLYDEFGNKIHLDVFSSFEIYGWFNEQKWIDLFEKIKSHPGMTYHGYKSNEEVTNFLGQKAHLFAYPSIWEETSCIAMIEALANKCFVIHPTYGALTETGMNLDLAMPYEISSESFYEKTKNFIEVFIDDPCRFKERANKFELPKKHSLEVYKKKWEKVLGKNE